MLSKHPLPNVNWRKYLSINNIVLNDYLKSYGDTFLLQTLRLLTNAHQKQIPSIVIIEFIDTNVVSVIEQQDYLIALAELLTLCEHLEKYEICAQILEYQQSIKLKPNRISKSNNRILTINN